MTIFGQSAGGGEYPHPSCQPAEQRALPAGNCRERPVLDERGGRSIPSIQKPMPNSSGKRSHRASGTPGPDAIAQMRTLSPEDLINATPWPASSFQTDALPSISSRRLTAGSLPDSPDTLFRLHRENPVPLIIGNNANDGTTLSANANMTVPEYSDIHPEPVREGCGCGPRTVSCQFDRGGPAPAGQQIMTDYDFTDAAKFVAGSMADLNRSTYLYRYSYVLPGQPIRGIPRQRDPLTVQGPDTTRIRRPIGL